MEDSTTSKIDKKSVVGKRSSHQAKKYSMSTLNAAFGKSIFRMTPPLGKNVTMQMTYQALPANFEMMLNKNGPLMNCFFTTANSLAIYNFSDTDVDMLNALLHYLIKTLNAKPTYKPLEMEKGHDGLMTKFIPCDVHSEYFNKNSLIIRALPSYCFQAEVRLKVMGLQYDSYDGNDTVKLFIRIQQVKVMEDYDNFNGVTGDFMTMF
jgi:hypothetical protein